MSLTCFETFHQQQDMLYDDHPSGQTTMSLWQVQQINSNRSNLQDLKYRLHIETRLPLIPLTGQIAVLNEKIHISR